MVDTADDTLLLAALKSANCWLAEPSETVLAPLIIVPLGNTSLASYRLQAETTVSCKSATA